MARKKRLQTATSGMVIYVRVSTAQQAAEGISLDSQESACRTHAERLGVPVLSVHRDEGMSGKDSVEERPGLQSAIAAVQAAEGAALLVYSVSRVARRQRVLWGILDDRDGLGIPLVSATEPFETASPMGRAMLGMLGVFAQLTADMIGQNTSHALAHLKASGVRLGPTPIGSTRLAELDSAGRRILAPDAADQATIARITELRAAGLSFDRIAATLTAENRPTKRGGKWHGCVVNAVLQRVSAASD